MNNAIEKLKIWFAAIAWCSLNSCAAWEASPPGDMPRSPNALAITDDGQRLYVSCATTREVLAYNTADSRIDWRIEMPQTPTGLALSKGGEDLFVTCAASESTVCLIDVKAGKIRSRFRGGHSAMAPVVSADKKILFFCNRFDGDVTMVDLTSGREVRRIRVEREPVAAALTPDGKTLVVANHLHTGAANTIRAGAKISLIRTDSGEVQHVGLSEGCGLLRGVAVSPDGRFAAVTHLRSMYWLTTTEVNYGRMNCNGLSFLDLQRGQLLGTILLDQTTRGAANPWAVAWLEDGRTVAVTHAGTHELSLVNGPVDADGRNFASLRLRDYEQTGQEIAPSTPEHPVRLRTRIAVPGNGPRAIAAHGSVVYVANYFTDDICRIDLSGAEPAITRLALGNRASESLTRRGERLFNDATLCFQGWQSCASCHDVDGRIDALNWDLLNDGVGNPKNTKSLVLADDTAPAMSLGVRENAEAAIRAGIRHILFTNATDELVAALNAWLCTVRTVPGPALVQGKLSASAKRGEKIFFTDKAGCAGCHPPPLFTDRRTYDVGTACTYDAMWGTAAKDEPGQKFDTPSLLELWRTAPYLHDGSATTLREVITSKNPQDQHGTTSHLSPSELEDLVAYLMSL